MLHYYHSQQEESQQIYKIFSFNLCCVKIIQRIFYQGGNNDYVEGNVSCNYFKITDVKISADIINLHVFQLKFAELKGLF